MISEDQYEVILESLKRISESKNSKLEVPPDGVRCRFNVYPLGISKSIVEISTGQRRLSAFKYAQVMDLTAVHQFAGSGGDYIAMFLDNMVDTWNDAIGRMKQSK